MCRARMKSLPGSDKEDGGLADIQLNAVSIFSVISKKFPGTVTLSVPHEGILRCNMNHEERYHPAL